MSSTTLRSINETIANNILPADIVTRGNIPALASFWEDDVDMAEFDAATKVMWVLDSIDNELAFEVKSAVNDRKIPLRLRDTTSVASFPPELAELARIFYSQWNTYIHTATRSDGFVGLGMRANDTQARAFYEAYRFVQQTVVFHFRLNLAILKYQEKQSSPSGDEDEDSEGGDRELMSPLVAYAAYIILGVGFANAFNDTQKSAWRELYAQHVDLHDYGEFLLVSLPFPYRYNANELIPFTRLENMGRRR